MKIKVNKIVVTPTKNGLDLASLAKDNQIYELTPEDLRAIADFLESRL
jgi:hypothetical protein